MRLYDASMSEMQLYFLLCNLQDENSDNGREDQHGDGDNDSRGSTDTAGSSESKSAGVGDWTEGNKQSEKFKDLRVGGVFSY